MNSMNDYHTRIASQEEKEHVLILVHHAIITPFTSQPYPYSINPLSINLATPSHLANSPSQTDIATATVTKGAVVEASFVGGIAKMK